MKKILLTLITAGLILTASACSCGGNTIETTPQASAENKVDETAGSEAVISDDEEDIFGDESDVSDDDNSDGKNQNKTETKDDNSSTSNSTDSQNTAEENSTAEIDDETSISAYASYITAGTWVNPGNNETMVFNDDGTFSGTINGEKYSGTFNMRVKETGVCTLGVTLKGTKKEVEFTATFKNPAEIILTTDKGNNASFACIQQ